MPLPQKVAVQNEPVLTKLFPDILKKLKLESKAFFSGGNDNATTTTVTEHGGMIGKGNDDCLKAKVVLPCSAKVGIFW